MRVQSYITLSLLLAVAGFGCSSSGGGSSSGGSAGQSSSGNAGSSGASSSGGASSSTTGGSSSSGGASSSVNGGSSALEGSSAKAGGSGGTPLGGTGGKSSAAGGTAGSPKGGESATGGSDSGSTGSGGKSTTGGTGGTTAAGGTDGSVKGGTTATGGSTGGSTSPNDAKPSEGCNQARKLQDGNQNITSGGQARTWYVKAPKNYDSTHPYRVVFQWHWNYGSINAIVNPPDADKNTDRPFYGMEDYSGDTTIYVVPMGLENGWANTGDRDTKLFDDIYSAVTKGLCVDTSRVFTTGFSYGGAISLKLACTRPDKFRAALVYDTGTFLSGFNQSECKTPIPFFESHGLDDQTFNYDMGLTVLGIFTKLNGCKSQTPTKAPDNGHVCMSFEGCSDGNPVRFCNFGKGENNPKAGGPGGHYPSPKDPGETVSWVPKEAWNFLAQF